MVASVIRPCVRRRAAAFNLPADSAPPATDITAATRKPPALRTIIFAVTKVHARPARTPSAAPA